MSELILVVEMPDTIGGHRFFTLPGTKLDASQAADICQPLDTQWGPVRRSAWVGVAKNVSQTLMADDREGVRLCAVLTGFDSLPDLVAAEVEVKLTRLADDMPKIVAATNSSQLDDLVIESPLLAPYFDKAWEIYALPKVKPREDWSGYIWVAICGTVLVTACLMIHTYVSKNASSTNKVPTPKDSAGKGNLPKIKTGEEPPDSQIDALARKALAATERAGSEKIEAAIGQIDPKIPGDLRKKISQHIVDAYWAEVVKEYQTERNAVTPKSDDKAKQFDKQKREKFKDSIEHLISVDGWQKSPENHIIAKDFKQVVVDEARFWDNLFDDRESVIIRLWIISVEPKASGTRSEDFRSLDVRPKPVDMLFGDYMKIIESSRNLPQMVFSRMYRNEQEESVFESVITPKNSQSESSLIENVYVKFSLNNTNDDRKLQEFFLKQMLKTMPTYPCVRKWPSEGPKKPS